MNYKYLSHQIGNFQLSFQLVKLVTTQAGFLDLLFYIFYSPFQSPLLVETHLYLNMSVVFYYVIQNHEKYSLREFAVVVFEEMQYAFSFLADDDVITFVDCDDNVRKLNKRKHR